jgi:hypothetical protein
MAQIISVRALNRSSQVRVTDKDGNEVKLSPTVDTAVDLDITSNRRALARHSAIGQWVVSAAGGDSPASGLKQTFASGGAAGAITVTGIGAGDSLVSVLNLTDSADLTDEFTVSDDDEIDNTGGTATTGDTLLVTYITAAA